MNSVIWTWSKHLPSECYNIQFILILSLSNICDLYICEPRNDAQFYASNSMALHISTCPWPSLDTKDSITKSAHIAPSKLYISSLIYTKHITPIDSLWYIWTLFVDPLCQMDFLHKNHETSCQQLFHFQWSNPEEYGTTTKHNKT